MPKCTLFIDLFDISVFFCGCTFMKDAGESFQYQLATLLYNLVSKITIVIWSEMRPQLDFRVLGPILDIRNLNFGPKRSIFNVLVHFFHTFSVSWDFVNSCIFGPIVTISAPKLNIVPKNCAHNRIYLFLAKKLNKMIISHIFDREKFERS